MKSVILEMFSWSCTVLVRLLKMLRGTFVISMSLRSKISNDFRCPVWAKTPAVSRSTKLLIIVIQNSTVSLLFKSLTVGTVDIVSQNLSSRQGWRCSSFQYSTDNGIFSFWEHPEESRNSFWTLWSSKKFPPFLKKWLGVRC